MNTTLLVFTFFTYYSHLNTLLEKVNIPMEDTFLPVHFFLKYLKNSVYRVWVGYYVGVIMDISNLAPRIPILTDLSISW